MSQNQNLAPLPQRVPATPEIAAFDMPTGAHIIEPECPFMDGWYRELTATGDRPPLQQPEEVQRAWGLPYGTEVASVILPGRSRAVSLPKDDTEVTLPFKPTLTPEDARDQSLRTLHVFDARPNKHSPPHFIVASESALRKIAATHPRLRGIMARLNKDIHHIYAGDRLQVGASKHGWLPSALRRRERTMQSNSHETRRVISNEQTLFYVGEDNELHVRSEGYNSDIFVAHPNAAELKHKDDVRAYERDMRAKIAEKRITQGAGYVGRHAVDAPTGVLAEQNQ